jgi:hypothetical protein
VPFGCIWMAAVVYAITKLSYGNYSPTGSDFLHCGHFIVKSDGWALCEKVYSFSPFFYALQITLSVKLSFCRRSLCCHAALLQNKNETKTLLLLNYKSGLLRYTRARQLAYINGFTVVPCCALRQISRGKTRYKSLF